MKLTPNQISMVHLFNRSPKDADGWSKISTAVWPLISDLPAELFQIEGSAEHGGRVRLTAQGEVVIPYL